MSALPDQDDAGGEGDVATSATMSIGPHEFHAPLVGWDTATGDELYWRPTGRGADLQNGHVEIWGSSGMGKTQFTMSLLAQLAWHSGSRFGIADFKNGYSYDTGFPAFADAGFLDLWTTGAPYNPVVRHTESQALALSTIRSADLRVAGSNQVSLVAPSRSCR